MPPTSTELQSTLSKLQKLIEPELERFLQLSPDCPSRLQESMSYSLLAGGKRLRPALVLIACEACGGDLQAALPAACAIEMVHTYSLIHDDLPAMDDDDLRRGHPTNHRQFDEATAILAGDGLLTYAFEVIANHQKPESAALSCVLELSAAAGPEGMVGGQMADLQAETETITELDGLEKIHFRKTGRLLRAALRMGAITGGADDLTLSALSEYGYCLGLAFQITDDLLDITGNQAKMGKAVQKDQSHGKATYPGLLGVEASRERAAQLVQRARELISPLGNRSQQLEQLANFVLERDH
ncbi:Farnesyl diphosphate synthase [Polystyrenella longa]|uniref:Farnesyl diphosphate synthase n=1 Tax=Polystyrenella longa TaxID=2528007 RepID=A0A518CM61_9PLAN|nr:farnesyl diphosphate synthase [Polystyrenella longa]QDU80319.1 Farnesyl diphosphate synthase [Polystyrenella longa]